MKYDKDTFVDLCAKCGYCNKKIARGYIKWTGKDEFTDNDFIEAYRLVENALSKEKARNKYMNQRNGRRTKRYKQSQKMGSPNQ